MTRRLSSVWIAVLALPLVAFGAGAQNIEDMVKWQTAEAVHYDVVAGFNGQTTIMKSDAPTRANYAAPVTDRFEMAFDWNPTTTSFVGKPTFRNFPSALPQGTPSYKTGGAVCVGPKISSPYDHVEVTAARAGGRLGAHSLELTGRRTYGAGFVTSWNEYGCNNWVQTAASSETVTLTVEVPMGLLLVLPKDTLPRNMTLKGADTLIVDDSKNDGWTYTYTLKIVK
jgi:hypothetical protein